MIQLYDILSQNGFLKSGKVNKSKVANTSVSTLIDLAIQIAQDTFPHQMHREQSIFAQSASLSLGGGREYCAQLKCRKQRIHELAQFALLYSDRVYIKNFLTDHIPHPGGIQWPDDNRFRQEFANDLVILNQIRPLVKKGIIIPFSQPLNYCPHCLAAHILGHDSDTRLNLLEKHLTHRFTQETTYEIFKHLQKYILGVKGPETLIDHGLHGFMLTDPPDPIPTMPRLMRRLDAGETVPLSKTLQRKLPYHHRLTQQVIQNIAFELTASQSLNTSFLTERPLHIESLAILTKDDRIHRRNLTAQTHLTSFVPFLNGVPLHHLIKLRENEAEAFILYRQALNKAIDEFKGQDNFTPRDAQALYSDVIAPKLTALDAKVKSARKNLLKDSRLNILAWVGAISFGIYAGFVPADLVGAAEALGLTKILADLIKLTLDHTDITSEIRNEDMYFLWRVGQAANKLSPPPTSGTTISPP